MLRAIAIYQLIELNENEPGSSEFKDFKKIKSVHQSKMKMFANDDLEELENKTLPKVIARKIPLNIVCHIALDREHHYIKRTSEHMIAIISKSELDSVEYANLFRNINHALKRESVNTSLENIIANPLGYTGRDILLDKTQHTVEELKQETFKLIEKVLERGEKIEVVLEKTIKLEQDADRFRIKAKKLNSCCG